MRLDSAAFLAVFAFFFVIYTTVPARAKRVLLVLGSLAFYATLSPRYLPLLLGLGGFTFLVGGRLHRETEKRWRDGLLYVGVGVNVLALILWRGAALGLSFYALQAISYVVDIHRRAYEPPKSAVSFLASFTLFPHLMSGPIVRTSFLSPLVDRVDAVKWPVARRALLLFTVGLFKKALADKLGPIADGAFDAKIAISPLHAWTGLIAYAAQLYGDFSGYTDMATAIALLLGLDLPPNFDLPYLATSPADFWRRWHISLSTWLRDYVYMPLGVRLRRKRTLNLVLTWMVAGLWHGTSWLYLVYGAYHGLLLAGTDWLTRRFGGDDRPRGIRRVAQTLLTFYLVLLGYVLFRAHSASAALHFFVALHTSQAPSVFTHATLVPAASALGVLVLCHLVDHTVRRSSAERSWVMWPAMAAVVTCLALFSGPAQPFIYFAF